MSVRFLANAGRIIMSKAGFDASPNMPDEQKIFDSNWMATGLVIAAGLVTVPSGSGEISVPFPYPLHYEPAASLMTLQQLLVPLNGRTTKEGLYLARLPNTTYAVHYFIFAVGI